MVWPMFPRLLSPVALGPLRLPNRLLMGSMHTGLEEAGDWGAVAAFYARRASAGLIVTGGVAPCQEGAVFPGATAMVSDRDAARHRRVTDAVHAAGGRIALQLLHAGRYAMGPDCVAPSAVRSPISPFAPLALDAGGVERTLQAFGTAAALAAEAGYDGVEVMGSEGYLINQFLAPRTNRRDDAWGGGDGGRRFAVEVVARVRAAIGPERALLFRISLADLVEGGQTWGDVALLARAVEAAGADALDSGVGWHEARVPTIAASVPRGAWTWLAARLKGEVGIPVVATNRLPSAEDAERVLADGVADLVSMARPFLADPDIVVKARGGRPDLTAPCIACNQACLDRTFEGKLASCLVNPRAGRETTLVLAPADVARRVAVVGAGAAGMAAALACAERGHRVTLWERDGAVGGQMRLAAAVPGKEEFGPLLRWFEAALREAGVELRLGAAPLPDDLAGFDAVVVATGVRPRRPGIPGEEGAPSYAEVLSGAAGAGGRVALVGAGPIGFDVATALVGAPGTLEEWRAEWGVGDPALWPGGLAPPRPAPPARAVTMAQRRPGKPGRDLGRTTGWIHRLALAAKGVEALSGVAYEGIGPEGLRLAHRVVEADTVVLCAGQESEAGLAEALRARGVAPVVVGGARDASGVDAERAIREGVEAAALI